MQEDEVARYNEGTLSLINPSVLYSFRDELDRLGTSIIRTYLIILLTNGIPCLADIAQFKYLQFNERLLYEK